jgi:hypothetical protein
MFEIDRHLPVDIIWSGLYMHGESLEQQIVLSAYLSRKLVFTNNVENHVVKLLFLLVDLF